MSDTPSGPGSSAEATPPSRHPLAALHDPATIRLRCAAVMRSVEDGASPWFKIDRSALPALADRVAALTRERFPDLRVPLHSRWRHFEAGGVDRKAEMDAQLMGCSTAEVARARFDLTVVSVLLDAGAGPAWAYTEGRPLAAAARPRASADELLAQLDRAAAGAGTTTAAAAPEAGEGEEPADAAPQARFTRSEGLGVASFRAFMAGVFSSQADAPLRADASALRHVDAAALRAVFQSRPSNPVVGLEGRAALLAALGRVLATEAARDATEPRPGLLFDRLTANGTRTQVAAGALLSEIVRTFAPIWPSGSRVQGLPAGDVWPHPWAGADTDSGPDLTTRGWVPFHKLSQWLTYSLIEPLQWAGVQVTGLEALTGLPEYRNGGLLLDGGVIVPRDARRLGQRFKPSDGFVIEWRALTVLLLDELAALVRERLGVDAQQLPLAAVLEGGTWAAGRAIARERRSDGAPPLQIDSDGTVF